MREKLDRFAAALNDELALGSGDSVASSPSRQPAVALNDELALGREDSVASSPSRQPAVALKRTFY